jgi:asparagine synthase (glutamine-hydrolysing)
MCGIAGVWSFGSTDVTIQAFRHFNDSLTHRGPDGAGVQHFPSERLHLGHRRLAIIDLSEMGHQPMVYRDRYWLTFNGEIYNFVELREELRALGHEFRSDSDSEVILAAFAQWGEACQHRFNGMWAFAIWDSRKRELFLSRDRFGVKPLHYCLRNGRFIFASELKAFLTLPDWDGSLDESLLVETLHNINGNESSEVALLPGVRRLLGGHSLLLTPDGTLTQRRWWNTLDYVAPSPWDFADQTRMFREAFFEACRLRLRSDVPVGTSLSGGLDSSAVAGTMAQIMGRGQGDHAPKDWQQAFVACFPGTNLDEERYARIVIDSFGLVPHYYTIDGAEAVRHLEEVVFAYESIYWVPLVGPWSIYREMRRAGVIVSLDGHGADELIGGYHFFIERELEALLTLKFRLGRYRDLKQTLLGLTGGSAVDLNTGLIGDLRILARRLLGRGRLAPLLQIALAVLRRMEQRNRVAGNSPPTSLPPLGPLMVPFEGPRRLYTEADDHRYDGMTPLGSALHLWFHHSVLPTLLRNYDRASMAHGVEVRMPFMDWRLVALAFGLPDESKIGHGYTKRVLREAMKGVLPDSIRLRTNKIGFTSPLDQWMRGALREWVMDIVASRDFQQSSLWNGANVRVAAERAMAGFGSFNVIWPILNAYALQREFKRAANVPLNYQQA